MSKELEALERITEHLDLESDYFCKLERFDENIIKNALERLEMYENETQSIGEMIAKKFKALEIIKGKTKHFVEFDDNAKTIYIDCALNCDNQEFDLLKEVLS